MGKDRGGNEDRSITSECREEKGSVCCTKRRIRIEGLELRRESRQEWGKSSTLESFRGTNLGNVKEYPEEAVNLRFLFYYPFLCLALVKH